MSERPADPPTVVAMVCTMGGVPTACEHEERGIYCRECFALTCESCPCWCDYGEIAALVDAFGYETVRAMVEAHAPSSEPCSHEPMAAGDARDGGPVFCRLCQQPMRYRSSASESPDTRRQ